LSVSQASASTITFDGHPNDIFGDENAGNGLIVGTSDGYDFTSSGDHFHFIDAAAAGTGGDATSLLIEDRSYDVTMKKAGGGSFSLLNLQYAGNNSTVSAATSLVVTGFFTAGGSITTTLIIVSSAALSNAAFVGFNDLSSVVFDGTGGEGAFALENVEVGAGGTAAVPEPATIILLGSGLAAAYARRRRKA
jgi:PEP-CTERM motif-containing protein